MGDWKPTPEALAELEALARAATPGPREAHPMVSGCVEVVVGERPAYDEEDDHAYSTFEMRASVDGARPEADARYIAAASPAVVLALCEAAREVEDAEDAREEMRAHLRLYGRCLPECRLPSGGLCTCGFHDLVNDDPDLPSGMTEIV